MIRPTLSVRLAALYGAMFTAFGIVMPYLSPWFASRGLSVSEIALLAAVPHVVRVFSTPVIAFLADRHDAHRQALLLLAIAGACAWAAMVPARAFWWLLLLQVLIGLTHAMLPLTETIAMHGVRRQGIDYGRVRLWGSVTFIAGALLAGQLVARYGIEVIMIPIIASAVVTALAAAALPATSSSRVDVDQQRSVMARLSFADVKALLQDRALLLLLLANSAVQASHAMLYTFGSLHWKSLGITADWIGALWAVAVLTEIALFAVAGHFLRTVSATLVLALGCAGATLRWLIMSIDPAFGLLLLLQTSHGVSFGLSHLGIVYALARMVPPSRLGTATALSSVPTALMFAAVTPLAGLVYDWGGGLGYLAMSVLSAIGLGAALLVSYRRT